MDWLAESVKVLNQKNNQKKREKHLTAPSYSNFPTSRLTRFARLLESGKEPVQGVVPTTATPTPRTRCTRSNWTTTPLTTTSWLNCAGPSKSCHPKSHWTKVVCCGVHWKLTHLRQNTFQDKAVELSPLHYFVVSFAPWKQSSVGES